MPVQAPSRLGQSITRNGHTYELQAVQGGAHRWVRTDKEPEGGDGSNFQAATENTANAQPPAGGSDPAALHQFAGQQLGSVQGPAAGVMRAMHAGAQAQGGKPYTTKQFAPEQAGALHSWLQANAGQSIGGGQVRDLGNGWLGFSSPAGAITVSKDQSGKFIVHYTHQTGVVQQAMTGGGGAGPATAPTNRPSARQGSAVSPAAAPGDAAGNAPGPAVPQPPPVAQANPVPPPVQAQGENPFKQPARESAATFSNKLTPEAAKAAGALTEKPQPSPRPDGPQTSRQLADAAKEKLAAATQQWEQELGQGLTPKGNARWRSYLAALKSIQGHHENMARAEERQQRQAGKAGQSGGKLTPHEKEASTKAPDAFKELQAMREGLGEDAYQDAVKQLASQGKPYEGRRLEGFGDERTQAERNPPISADPRLEQWRNAGDGTEKAKERRQVPSGALPPGSEQSAMSRLGLDPKTGRMANPAASKREIESRMLEDARKGFSTPAVEQPPESKLPRQQRRLAKLAQQQGVPQDSSKVVMDAIKAGHIQRPSQLRAVLRTAKKIHGRGDLNQPMTAAHTEAVNRLRKRQGREAWQAITKRQAESWDMKPEEYDSLARELHGEFVQHHASREKAKQEARQSTGLSASDINRLENQGLDSATARNFDTIGRELASNYPEVFGGQGYGDEQNVDYGSKLWDLIREGAKRVPSRTSPDFLEHIDDFLRQQLKGAKPAKPDDEGEAVPFWGRSDLSALVEKYRESLADRVRAAAAKTEQPTEAQAKAGNYRKGKVNIHGLTVCIENPKGSKRRPEWPPLSCHYGYISGVEGRDGDQLDVFIGPDPESEIVFVVDQVTANGRFDEHKCLLGFSNERAAKDAYLANYPSGWKVGRITPITFDQFKDWIGQGDLTKRIAAQV